MSAKDGNNVKKKYELVPPDGGWGYMIGIAVILNISVSTMFLSSYRLLFKEFLQEIGMSSTDVTLWRGVSAICSAIASYLTSPLLSIMSMRMLTLVATLIFNTGVIFILFVESVLTFHICHGILQGLGLGFIYNLSCTVLNDYFVKRRFMAICVVQSVIAFLTIVAPQILKWSLEKYGFRDTIMLMSGITIHNFIAVALIQPVKKHMKKVEISEGSSEKLLHEKNSFEESGTVPVIKLTNADGNLSDLNDKMYISSDNEGVDVIKKIIHRLVDKSLCKTFLMSCVCTGPALAVFADTTYAVILPKALYTSGWEQGKVSLVVLLYDFGDLAMRVMFVLLSNWLQKLGSQEIYVLGVTLGLVSRLGMLWSKSSIAMMVYNTLVGASHCAVSILIPLVVADAVSPDKFTAALGMLMMLSGLINLVLGPAFGAVKELTESYGPVFYLIASTFAIIVLFWSIELCYKKNKHKRLQRREYLRQKKLNK